MAEEKVPDKPISEAKELGVKEEELKNIGTTNALRTKNNTYKQMLDNIDMFFLGSVSSKPIASKTEVFDTKEKILAISSKTTAEEENEEFDTSE